MPQPDDGVRPRIVFPDLVPGKEYTAEVNIIFPFNPDEPDLPQPQPITRVIQTLAMDDSLPDITGKDFAVEKMTNTICLVFTNRKAEIDAYRITVREILRNGGLQPVHSLRHPALDKRVCFPTLKAATDYEISLASISGQLQSATFTISIKTLDEDKEWKEKWYKWRYFSFNQWIKMFDQYSLMAKKKKFWSRPEQLACPSMRSTLPCKAQLQDWKDLNNCSFKICPEAPDFDSVAFDSVGDSSTYTADWEADFQTYRAYLYPQWQLLLKNYATRFAPELKLEPKNINNVPSMDRK